MTSIYQLTLGKYMYYPLSILLALVWSNLELGSDGTTKTGKSYQNSLTLITAGGWGGGGNHHPLSEIRDCSGTECPIDLKPGCKFMFVRCLETYLKKLISLGHEGTLPGPFLPRVLRN